MSAQKTCPHCGTLGEVQRWGKTAQKCLRYRCMACSRTFTNRTGTIRHRTRLKDSEWQQLGKLAALRTCPSGADIGRLFGKHVATGQRYRRNIRKLLPSSTAGPPLSGITELDETTMRSVWIGGGKSRNTGKLKLVPLETRDAAACTIFVNGLLTSDGTAFTDEWRGYCELRYSRPHYTVCHAREFVSLHHPTIHTNGIEGVWGHAKPLARHTYRGYPTLHYFLREVCFLFNFNYHERVSYLAAKLFRPLPHPKTNT